MIAFDATNVEVTERLAKLAKAAASLRELFGVDPTETPRDKASLRTAGEVLREGGPKEWS